MFRIQHLLLITVAALCSCATERTVATNFQPRQRPDSEKTDAELMDALEAKFAGGFGQQTDKEGNKKNKYKYDDRTIRLVEENWDFALKQWDYNL